MSDSDDRNESAINQPTIDQSDLGYIFFPKRRNLFEKESNTEIPIFEDEYSGSLHNKCLHHSLSCLYEDPFAKLLVKALKSSGCEFIPERHLSCEPCLGVLSGGYDSKARQLAICENQCRNYKRTCAIIKHELVHAYDYCRAKADFINNIDHLACTEIRAANFMHCSFLSAWVSGVLPPKSIKKMNEICVKEKAVKSVLCVRKVSEEDAHRAVDRVFDVCYRDLEPLGRKCHGRTFYKDAKKAYFEAKYYGYYENDDE